ncbi:hypothetical protein DID88_005074 [Monilinia fructigena]|uniref:PhoD-like phosphatase domain-containing protein n=1 Tax=Monilinia fructigena TaxID=38457 RepID=A0A395IVZ3_9HELO|nr:hypothetical protein DID88_005074 [Monilinia fructigena]
MARRTGKPGDELFMQRPGDGSDSPTVTIEPLRIVKPASPPRNRAESSSSNRFASPPPANKHTFPLPPGASSSANPLPYPDDDDDDLFQKKPNPPYPDDRGKAPRRVTSSDQIRFAASTSTTRATRGSPPPPETPIDPPSEHGGGIEARYAASGIAGTATLSSLQAQNAAAAQRANQYAPPPVPQMPQSPPARPWTPTESPENAPHGPPRVYQGLNEITPSASPPAVTRPQRQGSAPPVNTLEQDFQRMQMTAEEPPPAYSSVTPGAANSHAYPAEKQQRTNPPAAIDTTPKPNIAPPLATPANNPDHPAFANEPRQEQIQQQPVEPGPSARPTNVSPFQGVGPTSPPPLPEGWIAHLDQNSVHSTYAGYGNPMASPGLSMFNKQSLTSPGFQGMASPGFIGSPGFPPHTPGYAESIMSMASGTPTTAGFSGPPPSAGVDMYKVAPTNGVYFGPYLRYVNMDMENGTLEEVPLLKQWLAMSGKENRRSAAWTARHDEDVSHAYFHYYTSHFDQPYLREAFAQIPHILQIDDHDIFDGYGSYPEYMQNSNMFRNIGRIGIEMYLLFQHHTTVDILRNVSTDMDLFTITGTDCRSERNQRQVLAGPTYQGIFPKVATLPPSVQHCIWMISVPVIYPRLEAVESLAHTMATAGVVGGKEAVATGFSHVKKAVGKSGLMGGVLNTFGDIDIADELRDMWTHESKDLERTYLIRTLQGIAHQKGIRMTFLSGDVNCCGAGLVHDPSHPSDHKTMYQIIASAVVAAPPPSYVLKMLHNNKPLYVPQNGVKTTNQVSDTKEDMMEIFQTGH